MASIIVTGPGALTSAEQMAAAIHEIFGEAPALSSPETPSEEVTRGIIEVITMVLALPPAIHHTSALLAKAKLGDQLRRLIDRASTLRQRNGDSFMIDPGDGRPIPLEKAAHETILAALF